VHLVKLVSWAAIALAAASIAFSVYVVVSSPRALAQFRANDFPLTGLGEGVIAMLLPILLSSLSCLLAVPTVRRKLGQAAMIVSVCSWLVVWKILGSQGFHHLF
jgi:hypothetical protein